MADPGKQGTSRPSAARILDLIDLLACPDCRGRLTSPRAGRSLECEACATRIPVAAGFPLFPERAARGTVHDDEWTPDVEPESRVLEAARRSPADAYAAFQPFNESGRTLLGLVALLRRALRPGDAILDTWNRTGWTGEMLAGLFPEQRIVSVWEGNHGSLGYRGFARWLGDGRGAPNLHVVFHAPDERLPFASGAFAMVHAYDTLHRYRQDLWLPELARVSRPEAPIVFPHVHLANGRPDPFFEREGTIRHGRDYGPIFAGTMPLGTRRVFVMGERQLFEAQEREIAPRLENDPETTDYNGIVALLPQSWAGAALVPEDTLAGPLVGMALLPSPLCRAAPHDGTVSIDDDPQGVAARVLPRHPVYAERLQALLPCRLAPIERMVLYWAERLPDAAAVGRRLGLTDDALRAAIERLASREVLRVARLGRGAVRLQRFHGRRETAPLADEDDLGGVWRRAVAAHGDRTYIVDDDGGRRLTYAETDVLVSAVRARLRASGVGAGDRVALYTPLHVEAVLLFWAAVQEDVAVAVLDPHWSAARVRDVLASVRPVLLFADAVGAARLGVGLEPLVVFDEAEDAAPARGDTFSSWLGDVISDPPHPDAAWGAADRPAVVLFTSGTSGDPKGVVLTQHAVAHSGRLLARHGDLRPEDVHFGLGELHTMSGFRNPCVAAVHAGAAVVVASRETRERPLAVADCISRWGVTVLSAVPSTLRVLTLAARRSGAGQRSTLRRVLCTGTRLPATVREAFEATVGCPVHDYYGLTETAGLCIGRPPGGDAPPTSIGQAVDALVRVVDSEGRDLETGGVGELWIHNANLMAGYFGEDEAARAGFAEGWYRTGDLARLGPAGHVELVGRRREIVKSVHGEIVTLREIEDALLACGDVADAGVFVTRRAEQEIVHAVVVPASGLAGRANWLEQLRRRLLERLGPRRMPSRLVMRDAIPRRGGAKVPLSALGPWLDDAGD